MCQETRPGDSVMHNSRIRHCAGGDYAEPLRGVRRRQGGVRAAYPMPTQPSRHEPAASQRILRRQKHKKNGIKTAAAAEARTKSR